MDKKIYLNYLQKYLSPDKLAHSLAVADIACKLADRYNCDKEKAYLAGLLHDAAREFDGQKNIEILKKNNYALVEEDYLVPEILHGAVAARMLREELLLTDAAVLQAIERHTTGAKEMSVLDAVIFIADMIEPMRDYPGVQELRVLAERDLYEALLKGIKHTLNYLLTKNQIIHPKTINTYNWLLQEGRLII